MDGNMETFRKGGSDFLFDGALGIEKHLFSKLRILAGARRQEGFELLPFGLLRHVVKRSVRRRGKSSLSSHDRISVIECILLIQSSFQGMRTS